MLPCSLDGPDPIAEPNYSAEIAAHLRRAYRDRQADSFPAAKRLLGPFAGAPMSHGQKMRLHFAIGCEAIHDQRPNSAIEHLDEALEIAASRDDAGAFAVIAQKQALAHYELHSFVSAADYYQDALVAAQAYRVDDSVAEPETFFQKQAFLLELLWGLMTQHFLTANYDASQTYVEDARQLGRTIGRPLHRIAAIEWTAALLHRWQQAPLEAHNVMQKARTMYNTHSFGSPVENARLEIAAADIALDVVASLGSGSFASSALGISKKCVSNALLVSEANHDMAGQGMALLALVRLNRFQSQPTDRATIVQHVLTQSLQMGDRELQCQAYTALGDELIARGQQGPGLNAYRKALKVVASSDGTAMGKWALQRLLDAMNGMATA